MRVSILPSGALLADTASGDDEAGDGLSVAARGRVTRAFGRGPGHGVLQLGAAELEAPLSPPLAFLRDIGRAFMTRLCAVPDLEERRERVDVCPADERSRLAAAVPPMDGSEYVDGDWIGARCACKHLAAVLYGVGIRLDTRPELFFVLRQVDQAELLSSATAGAVSRVQRAAGKRIADDRLSAVFGIELDDTRRPHAQRRRRR